MNASTTALQYYLLFMYLYRGQMSKHDNKCDPVENEPTTSTYNYHVLPSLPI